MKKKIFTGLFLIVLTLCSCSRKKTEAQTTEQLPPQASIRAETPGENFEWIEEEDPVPAIEEEIPSEETPPEIVQTLDFLENEANFTSPIIEDTQVESVEKRLIDAYNRLKVMEFESEIFIPSAGMQDKDSSILVHYSKKAAVRLFYDNLYRLTKKEYWKMESVENAALSVTEKYSYEGEAKKPYEKIIESENTIFVSKLNENGLVIRTEKYDSAESLSTKEGALSTKEGSLSMSKGPVQTTVWTYDDKKRITSEAVTEGKLVKKQVFDYSKIPESGENEDNLPPDYEYYENGVLVTKTEYIKKGFYSTTIWFDTTNSVRTDYENYVKVRDVYYTNGVERRVKNYE